MSATETSIERRLATVAMVDGPFPIPGADNIVRIRVRGWDVVAKRDEFAAGDLCVYFEVGSMLDITDPRFAFLAARSVRVDPDRVRDVHVLTTAKLRGQYSQGLALPIAAFPELADMALADGVDVTAELGIFKWDPPIPTELLGSVRGYRPSWVPSTGEERIQNIDAMLALTDLDWAATEKLDGESTTFYLEGDSFSAGTRNLDLLPNADNVFYKLSTQLRIEEMLRFSALGERVVVQGETYGAGMARNPLRLPDVRFAAFNLIVNGDRIPRRRWPHWLLELAAPIHPLPFPTSADEALAQVERLDSLAAPGRPAEGVVWRPLSTTTAELPDGRIVTPSFKVISNRYQLKNDQ